MELVIGLFTLISGMTLFINEESKITCKGNDIVDIYYSPDQENIAYDIDCRYTKTMRNCEDCRTYYIFRNHYDKFAEGYTKLGMQPPFPKRTDTDKLYKPKDGLGYRGG